VNDLTRRNLLHLATLSLASCAYGAVDVGDASVPDGKLIDMGLAGKLGRSLGTHLGSSLAETGGQSAPTLAGLGVDLLYWWEVPDAASPLITIASNHASQLNERVAGVAHLTQGTAGNRYIYHATGGPSNQPFLEAEDANRQMTATIALAAANRAGLFVVGAHAATPAVRELASLWLAAGPADKLRLLWDGDQFWHIADLTAGSQSNVLTVPAGDTAWHLFGLLPASTGVHSQIDGANTTGDFTGSSTMTASDRFSFGGRSGIIGHGSIAAAFIISDPTPAKIAILRSYVSYRYGSAPNAIVLAGQSNAYNLTIEDLQTVPTYDWRKVAYGGVSLAVDFAPGAMMYNALLGDIKGAGAGRVAVPWAQGESDCATPAWAAAYASNMIAFADALESASGRSDLFWIDTQLHNSLGLGTAGDRNLVRAGKTAFVASRPGRAVMVDPNNGGSLLPDNVHWDAPTRALVAGWYRAEVAAHWP